MRKELKLVRTIYNVTDYVYEDVSFADSGHILLVDKGF